MLIADLHSHILPGIDDGAKDITMARALLARQYNDGVSRVAFTPHFRCEDQTLEEFLQKREEAFELLMQEKTKEMVALEYRMGAEVYFSPTVAALDFEKLCLQDTPYLLVELPVTHFPAWVKDVFYQLQLKGIVPILAHVERYPYIMKNPHLLYELVAAGALAQINASSLLHNKKRKKIIRKMINWNLVHVIASDAHSLEKRPPQMKKGIEELSGMVRAERVSTLLCNAVKIFSKEDFTPEEPHEPKRLLNYWV